MDKPERWMELCELAAKEPDPSKLIALTDEIARLLDEKPKSKGYGQTAEPSDLPKVAY